MSIKVFFSLILRFAHVCTWMHSLAGCTRTDLRTKQERNSCCFSCGLKIILKFKLFESQKLNARRMKRNRRKINRRMKANCWTIFVDFVSMEREKITQINAQKQMHLLDLIDEQWTRVEERETTDTKKKTESKFSFRIENNFSIETDVSSFSLNAPQAMRDLSSEIHCSVFLCFSWNDIMTPSSLIMFVRCVRLLSLS